MLKRLDHIGVVVDNLAEARSFLSELGLVHIRDAELSGRLKSSFWGCGDGQIEVIEISEPVERGARLGSAKARVEHIAIEVDDLAITMKFLLGLGVKTQTADPLLVGTTLNHWTIPESCDGVVYQFVERQ